MHRNFINILPVETLYSTYLLYRYIYIYFNIIKTLSIEKNCIAPISYIDSWLLIYIPSVKDIYDYTILLPPCWSRQLSTVFKFLQVSVSLRNFITFSTLQMQHIINILSIKTMYYTYLIFILLYCKYIIY